MAEHKVHDEHGHAHASGCGHTAVRHEGHVDYLHDGHLHHVHDGHTDEHAVAVSAQNPQNCGNGHDCNEHDSGHKHGASCGHDTIPHGDHSDYVVAGHLHNSHGTHCDDHGKLVTA